MQRRRFLGSVCAAAMLSVAGCLGDDSPTALAPPDHGVDSEALAYPAHDQELPTVTLPSALHGRQITTTEYVGDREALLTFVFTRCPGPCHTLTSSLAHVQAYAIEHDYTDEVALLPTTFDPEYDTPEELRAFSESNGANPDADNWHFLRPESPTEATDVINGTFGVAFEEVPAEEADHDDHADDGDGDGHADHADDDGHADDHDGHTNDHDGHDDHTDEAEHETTFIHSNLLLLVNRDGYVERAYGRQPPRPDEVLSDLEDVRNHFA